MEPRIHIDQEQIAHFCRKHHITRLALFGSVLTDHFTEASDVDILVEFDPAHVPGMIRLCGMERELSGIIGRKADVRTPGDLSCYFREEILNTAVVQYAA